MDCDTTGVEPDLPLKFKNLLVVVTPNHNQPPALERLDTKINN
jgi:hypothetical protein